MTSSNVNKNIEDLLYFTEEYFGEHFSESESPSLVIVRLSNAWTLVEQRKFDLSKEETLVPLIGFLKKEMGEEWFKVYSTLLEKANNNLFRKTVGSELYLKNQEQFLKEC